MRKIIYYIAYLCVFCLFSVGCDIVADLIKAKSNIIEIRFNDLISPSILGIIYWLLLVKIGEIRYTKKQ